jgi:hypothetical protein
MPDVMKTVGRYEILRELGRGGMALVYLARQTDLDRFVALKELGAFHASDASFAQRFLRESRVAGSLSHPNIVTVHDYFEHEGTPYIAMEYVERGSLRPYVGKMTLSQIGGVLEGLLAGLTNAEQNGIVHRDLKPENMMVTSDGRVKIADFGIAKATTKMQTGAFLTATGTTVGTPTYMAPEQAMAQDIGPWTDLYSVGCMAFEMFTGKVPFHDSDAPMAILLRHVNEPIPAVKSIDRNVDQGISDWVEKLLVKDPSQRTRSATDAWDDFEEIIIGLLGPRWRRSARLTEVAGTADTPNPLTPAPFQGTTAGAAASDEFQSFAWGQPAADTDGSAAPAPYTPPPQDLPPGPMQETPAPEAPPLAAEAPAAPEASAAPEAPPLAAEAPAAPEAPPAPAAPSDEPVADSGFVTFGAPAPSPPTDALVPPADAPPAEPPAAAPGPEVAPEPEVAATPEPEPQAEVAQEEPAADAGFETYIAPPPPRPPTEDPRTDALQGLPPAPDPPAPEPPAPESVAPPPAPEPEPVAAAPAPPAPPEPPTEPLPEPAREPEPAAAYEYDPNATVMPEALRRKAEAEAKPKKERKQREPKAAKPKAEKPKPVREGEKPKSKAFPIALIGGTVVALVIGFAIGGSGGGGEEPAADTGALTGSLAASSAGVKVPSDWSELGAVPDVPGLALSDAKAAAPGGKDGGLAVVLGTAGKSANNSTLLPLTFLQAIGDAPDPSGAVQIAGGDVQAYRYNALEPNGFDRTVTVYAAPTSAGVATLACVAPAADADSFAATCDQIANTLSLSGGEPYPVGPSKAYGDAVTKAFATLAKADKSGQAKLKAAKTPQAQAAAARSLSDAFGKAAKTLGGQQLSPADRGANALVVKALGQTDAAYGKLASAASKKSKAAYSKASGDVAKARKAVANALDGLNAAGYDVAA